MKRWVLIGLAGLLSISINARAATVPHTIACAGNTSVQYDPKLTTANEKEGEIVVGGNVTAGSLPFKCVPAAGAFVPTGILFIFHGFMVCPTNNGGSSSTFAVEFADNTVSFGSGKVAGTTLLQRFTGSLTSGKHRGTIKAAWVPIGHSAPTSLQCPAAGIQILEGLTAMVYQGT